MLMDTIARFLVWIVAKWSIFLVIGSTFGSLFKFIFYFDNRSSKREFFTPVYTEFESKIGSFARGHDRAMTQKISICPVNKGSVIGGFWGTIERALARPGLELALYRGETGKMLNHLHHFLLKQVRKKLIGNWGKFEENFGMFEDNLRRII